MNPNSGCSANAIWSAIKDSDGDFVEDPNDPNKRVANHKVCYLKILKSTLQNAVEHKIVKGCKIIQQKIQTRQKL